VVCLSFSISSSVHQFISSSVHRVREREREREKQEY
jgi:hypothetical protein